jgi:tRNA(Ile)-lysidine synthase
MATSAEARLPPPRRIAVACSGGRDSTALLHATLRAAKPLGIEVIALHVHHGLLAQADAWQAHLAAQCARWARTGWPLRLVCTRLDGRPAAGDSIEAWARRERYQALGDMARAAGCDAVLLAHHQRDQAETFLLQALRGAGVAGLAAMPASTRRDGISWLRPWLRCPRAVIDAYVYRHRLRHIEDDSNADPRFARNRLRLAVWPALREAFPQAEGVLADAAAWAAQARVALDELAEIDLKTLAAEPAAEPAHGLALVAWRRLSDARRTNALRAWLMHVAGRPAPATLVQRLCAELAGPPADRRGGRSWPFGDGWLREHRGMLQWAAASVSTNSAASVLAASTSSTASPAGPAPLAILRAGRHALPAWGGVLVVRRVMEGGVPIAWLAHAELRARSGGERFQAGLGRPARSLKRQYQAAGIPAWQREGPLLYSGGQLVFVPGLGLDARVIGLPGQPLVTLAWEAAGPAG